VEALAICIYEARGEVFEKPLDHYRRVLGWNQVAEELIPFLEAENLEGTPPILASDSRKLLAVLGFYAMPGEFRLARWSEDPEDIRDYYDLRVNLREFQSEQDQVFLWVGEVQPESSVLLSFAQTEPLGIIEVPVYHNLSQRIYLYKMRGFQGYDPRVSLQ
jgi:hypothetical protein